MYELIQITESAYYVNCPAKIGLVRTNDTDVVAIDSGSDKDAGRKLLRIIESNGWKLTAIFNTHSHADHIGGNRFLHDRTQCRIYAPGIERDFTAHPILEPAYLSGGWPSKDLRHKFLMAQDSPAELLCEGVLPENLSSFPLPGHSFDMVGFRTADGAVFLADCVSAPATLEKYGVGFLVDVAAHLETLERVRAMQARIFIPAHADVTEDISAIAQYNIDAVRDLGERIVRLCAAPILFDDLLAALFDSYGMTMTLQQHALVGSTLRSCLTWLQNENRLLCRIENNRLLWQQA